MGWWRCYGWCSCWFIRGWYKVVDEDADFVKVIEIVDEIVVEYDVEAFDLWVVCEEVIDVNAVVECIVVDVVWGF